MAMSGLTVFILAIIAAAIANSKNRCEICWFLLSLFFPILSLIALVFFCEKLPRNR